VLALVYAALHLLDSGNSSDGQRISAWLKEQRAESADDPLAAAAVNMLLAHEHYSGNLSEALRRYETAERHLKQAEDERQREIAVENTGMILLMLGEYERAETVYRSSLALAERLGLSTYCSIANLATIRARLGHTAESHQSLQALVTDADIQQVSKLSGYARTMLADVQIELGAYAAAIENARLGLEAGTTPLQAFASCVLSRAHRALGQHAHALQAARTAIDLADSGTNIHEYERLARLVFTEALHASGDRDAAHAALRRAVRTLDAAAACIDDPQHRLSFLTRVPENVRIQELARAWLSE
jgi:tetratricopeptide (TPR) repeat protein